MRILISDIIPYGRNAHLGISPHAHDGYFHSKFRKNLTTEERAMVDRVVSEWENYKKGK